MAMMMMMMCDTTGCGFLFLGIILPRSSWLVMLLTSIRRLVVRV